VNRDVVHPSLERVFVVGRADHELRNERIVAEEKVEPLLLTREQGGVEIAKIISSLLGVLDGMDDEAILEPNRVVRVALTPFEGVLSGLRENPEVRNTSARMDLALGANPAMIHGHLQNRGP